MSKPFVKRLMVGTAVVGAAALLLGIGSYAAGERVNTTKSILDRI